jgi:hypothetical protein
MKNIDGRASMKTYTVEVDGIAVTILRDTDRKFIIPDGWRGIGTALKPAWEPIVLARKPLDGTVAANVLKWGTGAINIDGCRIEGTWKHDSATRSDIRGGSLVGGISGGLLCDPQEAHPLGRFPANIIHDGSDEVVEAFPQTTSGTSSGHRNEPKTRGIYGSFQLRDERGHVGDSGSAARFFYSAKADKLDRWGSKHPTVKPVDLMRWLCRLVTPPGGMVLDPFAGSGSTGVAAFAEGFDSTLIEREAEYAADIRARIAHVKGQGPHSGKRLSKKKQTPSDGPLFGEVTA